MYMIVYHTYDPISYIYQNSITDELGIPCYSTTLEPLRKIDYFVSKFDVSYNIWVYVEAPLEPGMIKHPLDEVLTYADCRKMDYPNHIDYIDGIVKGDEEQVAKYIQDCNDVKAKWTKTMEPITLRQYYQQKLNLHINNNNAP